MYWELLSASEGFRIAEERLGSHACGTAQGTTTTRTYDDLTGRQHTIKTHCGSHVLQDLTYGYDLAGNLASRSDAVAGQTEIFKHDELNRLTESAPGGSGFTPLYSYDSNGQGRIEWQSVAGSYTYDPSFGRDWVTSAGSTTFSHDAVGNIKTRVGPGVPGGSQQIDYTAFDLPKRITSPLSQVDFAYDAGGTRVVEQSDSGATFYAGDAYQRTDTTAASRSTTTTYRPSFGQSRRTS